MQAAAPTCILAAAATLGVVVRAWRLPEAIWAAGGATLLVATGLLAPQDAWHGILLGTDVYLFLLGMMLLAELARLEGLFDWLAAHAARGARGSASRLFGLIYVVGILITVFLSNDATAVVLTPAVAAIARAARVAQPLPFLLICAFIANAASFVLPISNPANLVIYGSHMPRLADWLRQFALPSLAAILVTYVTLRLAQRASLRQPIAAGIPVPRLGTAGRAAAASLVGTALLLMLASARGWDLGLPTCLAGLAACALGLGLGRRSPWSLLRGISWGVIPLVAGLFVLVQALAGTGALAVLASRLQEAGTRWPHETAWATGMGAALLCNGMNNLPAGLIAGGAAQAAHVNPAINAAMLIGIDLGPNLSVTGSLATILWLAALRREGIAISAWRFLRLGLCVMPPALCLALAARLAWQ